jgi:hypothetical protein
MKDKNMSDDIQDVSGCNVSVELIENIEKQMECQEEVPVKTKRKYVWKGEKKRNRSVEHNEKIAKALTGRQLSEEHRAAIAEAMIGNENFKG